jgi:hypothetical protein
LLNRVCVLFTYDAIQPARSYPFRYVCIAGDQAMVDAQPATSSSAAAGGEEAAAAAAAAGPGAAGTAGTKDPRTVMEAVLVKMLAIYEQLANSTVLLATPQVTGARWQHADWLAAVICVLLAGSAEAKCSPADIASVVLQAESLVKVMR